MDRNKLILILLALLFGVQWFVSLNMADDKEDVLQNGTLYKFRVRPVDPYDPFRGKYVDLYFRDDTFRTTDSTLFEERMLFAVVENDAEGFAILSDLRKDRPDSGDFFEVSNPYPILRENFQTPTIKVSFPFSRFYMEEEKAPVAEGALRAWRSDNHLECWAEVRILDGETALQDVKVDGASLIDWAKREIEEVQEEEQEIE